MHWFQHFTIISPLEFELPAHGQTVYINL